MVGAYDDAVGTLDGSTIHKSLPSSLGRFCGTFLTREIVQMELVQGAWFSHLGITGCFSCFTFVYLVFKSESSFGFCRPFTNF